MASFALRPWTVRDDNNLMLPYEPAALDGETLDALLYDHLNKWAPCDDFFLEYVMEAPNVVDVGCGTGAILKRARADGHTGRLTGLDPDPVMLDQARVSDAAEWVLAPAAEAPWRAEFDLAIMSGNAFQCLTADETIRDSLTAIRRILIDGGAFVFDTRNPAVTEWRTWNPGNRFEVVDPLGATLRMHYQTSEPDDRGVVELRSHTAGPYWKKPLTAACELRFTAPDILDAFLDEAGFAIEHRYGTWDRGPFDPQSSKSIITVARAA